MGAHFGSFIRCGRCIIHFFSCPIYCLHFKAQFGAFLLLHLVVSIIFLSLNINNCNSDEVYLFSMLIWFFSFIFFYLKVLVPKLDVLWYIYRILSILSPKKPSSSVHMNFRVFPPFLGGSISYFDLPNYFFLTSWILNWNRICC